MEEKLRSLEPSEETVTRLLGVQVGEPGDLPPKVEVEHEEWMLSAGRTPKGSPSRLERQGAGRDKVKEASVTVVRNN